jgi:hypothetical protein
VIFVWLTYNLAIIAGTVILCITVSPWFFLMLLCLANLTRRTKAEDKS